MRRRFPDFPWFPGCFPSEGQAVSRPGFPRFARRIESRHTARIPTAGEKYRSDRGAPSIGIRAVGRDAKRNTGARPVPSPKPSPQFSPASAAAADRGMSAALRDVHGWTSGAARPRWPSAAEVRMTGSGEATDGGSGKSRHGRRHKASRPPADDGHGWPSAAGAWMRRSGVEGRSRSVSRFEKIQGAGQHSEKERPHGRDGNQRDSAVPDVPAG